MSKPLSFTVSFLSFGDLDRIVQVRDNYIKSGFQLAAFDLSDCPSSGTEYRACKMSFEEIVVEEDHAVSS